MSLLLPILVASLLGSLHCGGMCGAFVMLAVAGPDDKPGVLRHGLLQGLYHGGRGLGYVALGLLAGWWARAWTSPVKAPD